MLGLVFVLYKTGLALVPLSVSFIRFHSSTTQTKNTKSLQHVQIGGVVCSPRRSCRSSRTSVRVSAGVCSPCDHDNRPGAVPGQCGFRGKEHPNLCLPPEPVGGAQLCPRRPGCGRPRHQVVRCTRRPHQLRSLSSGPHLIRRSRRSHLLCGQSRHLQRWLVRKQRQQGARTSYLDGQRK